MVGGSWRTVEGYEGFKSGRQARRCGPCSLKTVSIIPRNEEKQSRPGPLKPAQYILRKFAAGDSCMTHWKVRGEYRGSLVKCRAREEVELKGWKGAKREQ